MRIYKYLLFLLLLTMMSCQLIHLVQTKERRDENFFEINAYFLKNDISSFDYSFLFIDSLDALYHTKKTMLNTWKLERGGRASAVELKIYNSEGTLVNAYSQCFGPFKKLNILDSYPPRIISHLPINYDLRFVDELEFWDIDYELKNQLISESKESAYIFVMYWNIWSNHFSKVVLKAIEDYLEKYETEDNRFLYILVNNAREPLPTIE